MKNYALVLACSAFTPLFCQDTPTSLRPDIQVEHYMDVRASASRLAFDPIGQQLYYLLTNGDVLAVIDDGLSPVHDTLLFTVADHLIDQSFGITFHDSDLFVIGNQVTGNTTQGLLRRGHLLNNGTRTWSTVAITGTYAWGGKAHGFNNVVVSPDAAFLYLNCGSRSDHGEVQDVNGAFPGLREEPITSKILRVPIDAVDLLLPNDIDALTSGGYIHAEGVRNTFDMAFDSEGRLFGVENSGDHDDPEEMNWLRPGVHCGFPWTAGGNANPTLQAGYDPLADHLLNPGYPAAATDFYYDASFPSLPGVLFTEPILNTGPDADRLRDPDSGGIIDASDAQLPMPTFTCHRSPLGLVFDTDSLLANDLRGDALMLSFTPGGDTLGYSPLAPWGIPVVPADPSGDLLHLKLHYDEGADAFTVEATRVVEGFYLAVDAELVNNALYVIENWGSTQRSLWKVTLPLASSVPEVPSAGPQLSVWPLPARGTLQWSTAQMPSAPLELIDAQGRCVLRVSATGLSGEMPLQAIQPGAYWLRTIVSGSTAVQRVLVIK